MRRINRRRKPENRLGFALQLCALRYPGRLLSPGELIPEAMVRLVASQTGDRWREIENYGIRENTRYEHSTTLQEEYGYRPFIGAARAEMIGWLNLAALGIVRAPKLAEAFMAALRDRKVIAPAVYELLLERGQLHRLTGFRPLGDAQAFKEADCFGGCLHASLPPSNFFTTTEAQSMKEHESKEELEELRERLEVLEAVNFMLMELLFAENPRLETIALANKHRIKTRNIAHEVAVSHLTGTIGEDHLENLINLHVGHSAKT